MALPSSRRRWSRAERFVFLCPLLLLVLAGVAFWVRSLASQKLLAVAYLPDGNILCAYSDARVVLRDGHSGHDLKMLRSARGNQVQGFAVSRDGKTFAVPDQSRSELSLVSPATGAVQHTLPASGLATYISFSPDGGLAQVHTRSSNAFIDTRSGVQRNVLLETGGNCVLALRDQKTGVAALSLPGGALARLGVRDTRTGKWLRTWKSTGAPIHALAISGDGRLVATASHEISTSPTKLAPAVTLYDYRTGKFLHAIQPEGNFGRLAFSPDGMRLAASLNGTKSVYVWDTKTGQKLFEVEHESAFNFIRNISLDWSPDGNTLLTGSSNDSLCLWDGHTGQQKQFSA